MATFLVERYGPGIHPAAARSLDRALAERGVRVIQAIETQTDDVSFWYVEAGSSADVVLAFESAALTIDRIAPARPGGAARG
jgi:hypothetical protein